MGTSTSSKGPGAGVPLDPAWLDDLVPDENNDLSSDILSQRRRFSQARRYLNDYIRSGSKDDLRKSCGHYSKSGMGGSRRISHRMRVATSVGSQLYDVLHSLKEDGDFELCKKIDDLKKTGAGTEQIISLIAKYACPNGGSIDELSTANSAISALTELLGKYPDADIRNLSDDQIWELVSLYLGNEVFSRIQMDIGQMFEKSDVSLSDRILRMNEMREFIKVEISVKLNSIRSENKSHVNIKKMLDDTIEELFYIYEGEL